MIIAPETRIWRPNEKPSFIYTQAYGLDHKHFLGPAGGLVGYWIGNEGAGNKLIDLSGNRNNLIFNGNTLWGAGQFGPATLHDGTGDYHEISLPSEIAIANPFTVVISSRQTENALEGIINIQAAAGNAGEILTVYYNAANNRYDLSRENNHNLSPFSGTIVRTDWNQLVVTQAGGSVKPLIYVNGLFNEGAAVGGEKSPFGENVVQFGKGFSATFDFTGEIEYVFIYNRILSAFEIILLYHEPFCMIQKIPFIIGGKTLVAAIGNPMLLEGQLINSPLLNGRLIA